MEIVNRILDRLVESNDIRIRLHDKAQTLSHRALANDSHELFVSLGKKPDGPLPYPDFDHKEYYAKNAEFKAKGDYEGLESYVDSLRAKHNITENVDDSFMKRRAEQIVRGEVNKSSQPDMYDRTMNAIDKTFPTHADNVTPITAGTKPGKMINKSVQAANKKAPLDMKGDSLLHELVGHVNNERYPQKVKDMANEIHREHTNVEPDMYSPPHGAIARIGSFLANFSPKVGIGTYHGSGLFKKVTDHLTAVDQHHDPEVAKATREAAEQGHIHGRHADPLTGDFNNATW